MNESVLNQLGKAENNMEKEMLEYIESLADEAVCEKIIQKKLTLKGCWEYCHKSGKKYAVGNCAAITPEQHFKWVREYFGIKSKVKTDKVIQLSTPKAKGISLNLDSLFD